MSSRRGICGRWLRLCPCPNASGVQSGCVTTTGSFSPTAPVGSSRSFYSSMSAATPLLSTRVRHHLSYSCPCYRSARWFSSPALTGGSGSSSNAGGGANDAVAGEYLYDPMEGVQRDAARETAKKSADAVLRQILPAHAPPSAFAKAQQYLLQHPLDDLITASEVHVTHIANNKGEDVKAHLPARDLASALQRARELGLNLVQMGGKDDVAFCRIRDEKPRILQLVQKELEAAEAAAAASSGQHPQRRKKDTLQHVFRDVVDAHFIGWKSKKIVGDIKKGHPVKLVIREFQSWEGAILKLQEMCRAMQKFAEAEKIPHHFTSINANSTEVSIQFSPPVGGGGGGKAVIKYPMEKEWANARKRMEEACRKSGRFGTYMKTGAMKPRSLGETTYRVDKYGRRIE